MSSRSVQVTIEIDTRRFSAAMRSVGRTMRQIERNRATRPVSAERREIQAIGRSELEAAIRWFKNRIAEQERGS